MTAAGAYLPDVDALLIGRLLRNRIVLAHHDRWDRDQVARHRARSLRALRAHALERSPFYARIHHGLEGAPLDGLPIVTKRQLMESFDEVVTDRRVRLQDVRAHLETERDGLFRDQYRVVATAGSTGLRGIFLSDPREWAWVMASYVRANDWAHAGGGLFEHRRVAVVSSTNPSHQSAQVGASLRAPFVETLRLDSTRPLSELTAELDAFEPQSLVGYASMLRLLAEEKLAGRLSIHPLTVMSASEVLTPQTRSRIALAFGREPFDVYAATETAGIASECDRHRLHLYEDLVITELVDDEGRPVPVGEVAAKIVVTVLFSRTQPLIRYEMSDTVRATHATCNCGRPYALIEAIEGRREDTLVLPAVWGGEVRLHPNLVHRVMDVVPASGWQLEETGDGLFVRLAGSSATGAAAVEAGLRTLLSERDVVPIPVRVENVQAIPRTALGKAPLIIARGPPPAPSRAL